jgi:hypothetical protein
MDVVRVDQKGFEVAIEEVRPVVELLATYLINEETVLFLGNRFPIGRLYLLHPWSHYNCRIQFL